MYVIASVIGRFPTHAAEAAQGLPPAQPSLPELVPDLRGVVGYPGTFLSLGLVAGCTQCS